MRLPSRREDRHNLYRDLLRRCGVSRSDRRERYRRLRTAYLQGSPDGQMVRSNRLARHVRWSSSYLFAPDSVRWGVTLPPHYDLNVWMEELVAAREEFSRLWHDSDAGNTANLCVRWGHVFDTVVAKVITSENEPTMYMVPDSSDIGVQDESLHEWDRQEGIAHWFTVGMPTFDRLVSVLPVERRIRLLEHAASHATRPGGAESSTLPPTLERVLIAASSPQMIGVARAAPDTTIARPNSDEPVIAMAELWVRDDEAQEWRVVTLLDPGEVVLWERLNPLNPGEHPFHELQLDPTPGYAWGKSPLADLLPLQEWREQKISDLDERQGRQIDPPMLFKGFATVDGEKAKLFRRRGGSISTNVPQAEVQPFAPPPLPDEFGMVHEIDSEFALDGDLPRSMTGQGLPGEAQSRDPMAQAMLGAGPTYGKAMLVENWLGAVGTAEMRLHFRLSGRTIRKASGQEFYGSQLPGESPWATDATAKVWGHSHSVLFGKEIMTKLAFAMQHNLLTKEEALYYLDLPSTELLIPAARHMEEAQAERGKKVIDLKEREVRAKELKAVK